MNIFKQSPFASRSALHTSRQRGYTLLELAVTMFIILTITFIARVGKTEYERSFALTNLAYDIALAIRQAQTYGVNTQQSDVTATGSFDVGYGVRFAPNSTSFMTFVDANNDRLYDLTPLPADTAVRNGNYTIRYNNRISSICYVPISNSSTCTPVNSNSYLTITFRRPDPDACLNGLSNQILNSFTQASCLAAPGGANSEARILIQAPNNAQRCVRVFNTGQITITPTCS